MSRERTALPTGAYRDPDEAGYRRAIDAIPNTTLRPALKRVMTTRAFVAWAARGVADASSTTSISKQL